MTNQVTAWIAGLDRRRLAAWTLFTVGGLLAVVVPSAFEAELSTTAVVVLSIGGGAVLWAGALWDEHIRHRDESGCVDERIAQIHYRAGFNAFWAAMAIGTTASFTLVNVEIAEIAVDPSELLVPIIVGGMVVFFASTRYYKRVM